MKTLKILTLLFLSTLTLFNNVSLAQSVAYESKKQEKLKAPSPFEAIISREDPRELVYQDNFVVAFEPLTKQAPVHLLIVPKKRIYTMNEVQDNEVEVMGHLLIAAKNLAKKYGIDKSGYRLGINTNEDAGQSVFHIHLHLLGGKKLGPIVEQISSVKE